MRRLPGTVPLGDMPWLWPDEAYAGQMALRDRLVAEAPETVIAALPESGPAVEELYRLVLSELAALPGFRMDVDAVQRPDGARVARDAPRLAQLARLVQEDLCVMEAGAEGHVLTAATLLFPAYWTLSEKLGRPLVGLHAPVPVYDADIARRVQRLFDGLAPERPIWRFNLHPQDSDALFTPRREGDPARHRARRPRYFRSERQILRRLPETGAVVFSIKTYLVEAAGQPEAWFDLIGARPPSPAASSA